jgi:hypothetical protein
VPDRPGQDRAGGLSAYFLFQKVDTFKQTPKKPQLKSSRSWEIKPGWLRESEQPRLSVLSKRGGSASDLLCKPCFVLF